MLGHGEIPTRVGPAAAFWLRASVGIEHPIPNEATWVRHPESTVSCFGKVHTRGLERFCCLGWAGVHYVTM